jgi:hypothetical protein
MVALLVPAAVLASGGDGGFDGVVSSIESQYHVHATRIPLMGLVSLLSRKATHNAVDGMHVAEFENFQEPVDGEELNRMVEQKLGQGWERIIRETSHNGKDQTLIYMHPEGERMGLFVVDKSGREMDVVQLSIDPSHLKENLGHYEHRHENSGDESD